MDDSTLSPPNSQWLSDSIIGGVIQRARPEHVFVAAADAHKQDTVSFAQPRSFEPRAPISARPVSADLNASLPSLAHPGTAIMALPSRGDAEAPAPPSTHRHETSELDKAIELRRERNRIHQARHKMRQRKLVADLEDGIVQLREEIQQLKLQRELIDRGLPATSNVWGVAAEFFRLFRSGVQPRTTSSRAPRRSDYNAQKDFMLSTMTADVTDGDVSGVDALLENWALQSVYLDAIDLQPVRMEKEPGDSLCAYTKGTLFINENTIRYAFPHLVSEDEQSSVLVSKMLRHTLELRGSVFFEWDNTTNRVAGVYCRVDLLTPLAHLLGSLEEVSYVFGKARITPEGRLAPNEQF